MSDLDVLLQEVKKLEKDIEEFSTTLPIDSLIRIGNEGGISALLTVESMIKRLQKEALSG